MRRRTYSGPETDQLAKLKQENRTLRKQISQLRKQFARVDLDRFQNLKDLLDSHDKQEQEEAAKEQEQQSRKDWECWNCREDHLRLSVIERRDGVFYFRKCYSCNRRTKLQKYTSEVKGLESDEISQRQPRRNKS